MYIYVSVCVYVSTVPLRRLVGPHYLWGLNPCMNNISSKAEMKQLTEINK